MKRTCILIAAVWVMAYCCISSAASGASAVKAVITGNDGTVESLEKPEEISRRITVNETAVSADEIPGYEHLCSEMVIFPKNATSMYLSLELHGLIPGDRMKVYQNGEQVPGAVTAENQLTVRLESSGVVTVYRHLEKEALEEADQEEMDEPKEAPKTGESDLAGDVQAGMLLFALAALTFGLKAHKSK